MDVRSASSQDDVGLPEYHGEKDMALTDSEDKEEYRTTSQSDRERETRRLGGVT